VAVRTFSELFEIARVLVRFDHVAGSQSSSRLIDSNCALDSVRALRRMLIPVAE
jgi:hypothetical protein